MYNEDKNKFLRSFTGICQGIIDIYNDEKEIYGKNNMKPWKEFKDQFIIITICDGFKELNSKGEFPEFAKEWGLFDKKLVIDTFCKTEKEQSIPLSIEKIAKEVISLYPETE